MRTDVESNDASSDKTVRFHRRARVEQGYRFLPLPPRASGDWLDHLKNVQVSDNSYLNLGGYEVYTKTNFGDGPQDGGLLPPEICAARRSKREIRLPNIRSTSERHCERQKWRTAPNG